MFMWGTKTIKKLNISNLQYLVLRISLKRRSASVLQKNDAYHRAPSYLSSNQLKRGKIYKFTDRQGEKTLLQVKTTVNGKKGIAEYILNKKGQVEHQVFRPGKGYTGKPQGYNGR
ncbi:hypothetical protein [Kurthia sibirica]|uniref:Uncharacterized protein n=1 Tax=Kurthia sibirica TaxID=202750 RepID=A0A2U3AN04_9BACL|nr:hypothetical protein [Kurthia sibirica]PWI25891.1 hypothetical protein DEX24_04980 [Kurthia sibirica]GEK35688.1 hypothetical protein KSI01_32210 [Kurthia sibirica]